MYKFLLTLHVLSAVVLIGPFVLVAFMGDRAIRRHDADDIRRSARLMARFAIGSFIVALFGAAALGLSDRYSFRTPWVIISLTLWLIAMGVATGYTVPAMRRAAAMVEQGVMSGPAPLAAAERTEDAVEPNVPATAGDLEIKERLDNIAGRVVGSATLVLVAIVIITILMVTRPFGS